MLIYPIDAIKAWRRAHTDVARINPVEEKYANHRARRGPVILILLGILAGAGSPTVDSRPAERALRLRPFGGA